jgi:hypothetical protein
MANFLGGSAFLLTDLRVRGGIDLKLIVEHIQDIQEQLIPILLLVSIEWQI